MINYRYLIDNQYINGVLEVDLEGNDKVEAVLSHIANIEKQSLKFNFFDIIYGWDKGVNVINPDGASEFVINDDDKVLAVEIYDTGIWRKVSLIVD